MERIYAVVEGQVQGVGFRWFVQSLANSLHLTGWIRNMENGMVEMELQGETASLHQLISRIRTGDRFIQVENISCSGSQCGINHYERERRKPFAKPFFLFV